MEKNQLDKVALIVRCQTIKSQIEAQLPSSVSDIIDAVSDGDKKTNFLLEQLRKLSRVSQRSDYRFYTQASKDLNWIESALLKGPKKKD